MVALILAFLFENPIGHPIVLGMGMTSAIPQGAEGLFSNPATLTQRGYTAFISLPYGGLGIGLNHLGLGYSHTLSPSIAMGIFLEQVGARLDGTYTGRYGEITAGLATNFSWVQVFRFGGTLKILRYQDPRSGALHTASLDLGILFFPQRFWTLGVMIQNANRPRIGEAAELIPASLEASLSFTPYKGATTVVGVRQVEGFPVRWSVGQVVPMNAYPVTFRFSFQREGDLYSAFALGINLAFSGMSVDYAAHIRPDLPLSHSFALNRVW